MNILRFTILTAALMVSFISCKERSETLPREVYSRSTEGVVMKVSPDVKSQMVAVIPFAEKINLTENSDKIKTSSADGNTKWYKTEWNGKSGWIQESSVGAEESVIEQIKKSYSEQKSNFSADFIKAYESSSVRITETFSYPGGEMEPAKMFFLSGGVMVLNSKIFTENYSNIFFNYEFLSDGKLLKIKFVDSKVSFNEYADVENSSQSVFKIDKNWGFVKE